MPRLGVTANIGTAGDLLLKGQGNLRLWKRAILLASRPEPVPESPL